MKSVVWLYFKKSLGNDAYAVCNVCQLQVKRGVTPRNYSTTPLFKHFKVKHNEIYRLMLQQKGNFISSICHLLNAFKQV